MRMQLCNVVLDGGIAVSKIKTGTTRNTFGGISVFLFVSYAPHLANAAPSCTEIFSATPFNRVSFYPPGVPKILIARELIVSHIRQMSPRLQPHDLLSW